jgi:hypothetical protein
MATYLQGVTDYIPEFQPFQPDFNFFASALQTKQNTYDKNWSKLNQVYGKFVNAPLTHSKSIANRDQYLKSAVKNIQKISGLDLSLEQNVQQAMQVFTPFYNDKNLLYDMYFTEQANNSLALGQSYQNCTGKDCEGLYWNTGIQAINYKVKEFAESNYDDIFNIGAPKYVPFAQGLKDAGELIKELGIDIETTSFQGGNIVTYRNGEVAKIPIYQALVSGLGNDPRYKEMYKTRAYVDRMSFVEQQVAAGVSKEEAEETFANNTVAMYGAMIADEAEKAKTQQASLNAMAIRAQNIIESIGMELEPDDPLVQTANTIAKEQQMAQRIYTDAESFVKSLEVVQGGDGANTNPSGIQSTATPNLKAKLNIAESIRAQALMVNDFTSYANNLSNRNAKIKVQRDPLAVQQSANEAARLRMLERLYLQGEIYFDANGNPHPVSNGTFGGPGNGFERLPSLSGSAGGLSQTPEEIKEQLTPEQRQIIELQEKAFGEGNLDAYFKWKKLQKESTPDADILNGQKFFKTIFEKAKAGDAYAQTQVLELFKVFGDTNETTGNILSNLEQRLGGNLSNIFKSDGGISTSAQKQVENLASEYLALAVKGGNANLIEHIKNGVLNPYLRGNEVIPEWMHTAFNSSNISKLLNDAADNIAVNKIIIENQNALSETALDMLKNDTNSENDTSSLFIFKNVIGDYKNNDNPMPYGSKKELADAIYNSILPLTKVNYISYQLPIGSQEYSMEPRTRNKKTVITPVGFFETTESEESLTNENYERIRELADNAAEAFYSQYVKRFGDAREIVSSPNTDPRLFGQGFKTLPEVSKANIDPAKGATLASNVMFYNMFSSALDGNKASGYNYSFPGSSILDNLEDEESENAPNMWAPKLLDLLRRNFSNPKSKSTFSITPLPIVNGTDELKGYQIGSVSESTLKDFAKSQGIDTKSKNWELFKTQMMSENGLIAYGNPNQLDFQPIDYVYEAPKSLVLFTSKQKYVLNGGDGRQKATLTYDPESKMISTVINWQVFNEQTRRYENGETVNKKPIAEMTNDGSTSFKNINVLSWREYIRDIEYIIGNTIEENYKNLISSPTTD